jgi:hypothetical protein
MRSIPGRKLWIGNAGDLRDPRAALAAGVEAVVELADSEPPAALPRDIIRYRFPISDGGENPTWLLCLAVEAVTALVRAEVPTLVACSAGMSRSPAIIACAMAILERRPAAEVLCHVASGGPVDVSPGLWRQLLTVVDTIPLTGADD